MRQSDGLLSRLVTKHYTIPLNERQKQTYYGVINLQTQECLLQSAKAGNSEETLALFENLLAQYPNRRIALIWDGASYHRAQAVEDYLAQVNQGLEPSESRITCIRFAPNDPTQKPIEDIWLQAKRFIREHYHLCQSFEAVKVLFELSNSKFKILGGVSSWRSLWGI